MPLTCSPASGLQVVQGIKVLGANVRHREKERAERATLVTQERLVKGKVRKQAPHVSRPCAVDYNEGFAGQLCCSMLHGMRADLRWYQGRVYVLPDVWIRPPFGGRGRKMTGQLEAHANGFRYTSPKGETLDIMYRCWP